MGALTIAKPELPTGLEETKAQDIAAQFKPMLDKMIELEARFNEIIQMDPMLDETVLAAKELDKEYAKVRIGTEKIHKEQKAFYLAAGRYVDGWKNTQLFSGQGNEAKLKEIIKYKDDLIAQKQNELREKRWNQLLAFVSEEPAGLGIMDEKVFQALLKGAEVTYLADKAESERLKGVLEAELVITKRNEQLSKYKDILPELKDISVNDFDKEEWEAFIEDVKTSYEQQIRTMQQATVRAQVAEQKVEAIQKEFFQPEGSTNTTSNVTKEDVMKIWISKTKMYQPELLSGVTFDDDDRAFIKDILAKFEGFKTWATKEVDKKYSGNLES